MLEFPRDSNKIHSISFALEKLDPKLCRGRYQMLLCYSPNWQSNAIHQSQILIGHFGETDIQAGQTVAGLTDDCQHGVVTDGVELEGDQPGGARQDVLQE